MIITLGIFIKNYEEWAHPKGFEYPRIFFALQTQDFANIMSILLLFLLSFILFYRNEDKGKNTWRLIHDTCILPWPDIIQSRAATDNISAASIAV